jgi:hypothetical protein
MDEEQWKSCGHPHTMLQFLAGRLSDCRFQLLACGICRRLEHLLVDARSIKALLLCEEYADGNSSCDRERADDIAMAAGLATRAERERAQAVQRQEEEFHPLRPSWWDTTKAVELCDDRENAAWLVWRIAIEVPLPPEVKNQEPLSDGLTGVYVSRTVVIHQTTGGPLDPASLAEFAAEHVIDIATKDAEKDEDRAFRTSICEVIRCVAGNPFQETVVDPAWLSWNGGTIARIAEAIRTERAFDRLPILADALEEAGCANAEMLGHCRSTGPHVRGCWVVDALASGASHGPA